MNAWIKLLAPGFLCMLAATACKVEVTDGDDETGGASSMKGGRSSGGATTSSTGGTVTTGGTSSTGGTATTGGTSSTGGTATTGGSTGGQEAVVCDGQGTASTPSDTCTFMADDLKGPLGPCLTCISKSGNCCTVLKSCFGDNPLNQCGYGGPGPEQTEFLCYQDCLVAKAKAAGGIYDPDRDKDTCAGLCVTPSCQAIGDSTSELIGCMHDHCEDECFVDPAQ